LVDDEQNVRIADFGLTRFVEETIVTTSHQGSARNMAPELFDPERFGLEKFRRTYASDVYAFACVCLELFTGAPPFPELPSSPQVIVKVLQGRRPSKPRPSLFPLSALSVDMWSLISACWVETPTARPKIADIIEIMTRGKFVLD